MHARWVAEKIHRQEASWCHIEADSTARPHCLAFSFPTDFIRHSTRPDPGPNRSHLREIRWRAGLNKRARPLRKASSISNMGEVSPQAKHACHIR